MPQVTLAASCGTPAHRSFWYEGLARRAGGSSVQDYLVSQANRRGFRGAFGPAPIDGPIDEGLGVEEIVVGLCAPQAPLEGRVFKLILRILQSGEAQPVRLQWFARRERADHVLFWLLQRVPEPEKNDAVREIQGRFASPPRGYRPPRYNYDPARLLRRPALGAKAWSTRRRSS